MAEASIPVDLLNPGQVFACLGFVETADILLGHAEGAFDWSDPSNTRFVVQAQGDVSPVVRVLDFFCRAQAYAELPADAPCEGAWKTAWGELRTRDRGDGYPFPEPASPATALCVLSDGASAVTIEHWGDGTSRDNAKFWAGSGGYPGVALARDALELVRTTGIGASKAPFALGAPQSSSFRFDWRRDYIPIDAGFSLNAHPQMNPVGFPLVELLAAIGLNHARPGRPNARNKLEYTYSTIGRCRGVDWFPLPFLRAALGGSPFPFPMRHFRMLLGWPGKEGQARAITNVIEEKKA